MKIKTKKKLNPNIYTLKHMMKLTHFEEEKFDSGE